MRFISLSGRVMPKGPCGGSGGVSYRIMKANEKYRLFDDTVFIFNDKCISSSLGEVPVKSFPRGQQLIELEGYYSELNETLVFDEEDCFVFHDLESFCAMKESFPWIIRTLVMYHQQGSIYRESLYMGNQPNEEYERFCFDLTRFAVEESHFFGFPSHGAKQALVDTLPEIYLYLEKKQEIILHNGCSPVLPNESGEVEPILEMLDRVNGDIFITVATLNEAKGVERLPAFFKEYGKLVDDYFWIVIGNGSKAGELEKGLSDLEGHVLWLNFNIDNSDIIRLYDKTDFYILSHRYSIFDYSTIEAMHMGCIPVLTPVGGNLEMIIDNNGYFLNDDLSANDFILWRRQQDIPRLKEQNQQIARDKFSEYSMLCAYYDLVSSQM